jgi:hypothetical protein
MSGKGYGSMLVEGFVRAIPWAIVFSAALVVTASLIMGMAGQEVKKALHYAPKAVIHAAMGEILHDPTFNQDILPKIKQNAKEAIEYTVTFADQKLVHEHSPKQGGQKK